MFDETSWGSGIEQLGLFFVTYCLLPWFTAWEEVIAQALLTDAEREAGFYAKFNEAALLRGSLKDQAEFLSKALGGPGQGGFMLPNEAREKMDMNRMEHPAGERPAWVVEDNIDAA
jgi:phage portal protein BeeE